MSELVYTLPLLGGSIFFLAGASRARSARDCAKAPPARHRPIQIDSNAMIGLEIDFITLSPCGAWDCSPKFSVRLAIRGNQGRGWRWGHILTGTFRAARGYGKKPR